MYDQGGIKLVKERKIIVNEVELNLIKTNIKDGNRERKIRKNNGKRRHSNKQETSRRDDQASLIIIRKPLEPTQPPVEQRRMQHRSLSGLQWMQCLKLDVVP